MVFISIHSTTKVILSLFSMKTNKDKYGEVFTPSSLVQQMIQDALLNMGSTFFDSIEHIFEPGAGCGSFYQTLSSTSLYTHGAYTMNEINHQHEPVLKELVANRAKGDRVLIQNLFDVSACSAELVWGNLPFHNGGKCFVPGMVHKKHMCPTKPETIWPKMIHYIFEHILANRGYFYAIIPCIWLKEDKAKIYDLFVRKHKLCFLRVFDCVEANALFGYECQTPVCYVMVQKVEGMGIGGAEITFSLFDKTKYIDFTLPNHYCIPTKHGSLFQDAVKHIKACGSGGETYYARVKKVACMRKKVLEDALGYFDKHSVESHGLLEDYVCENGEYKVIRGSSVDKSGQLILHGFVSRTPGLYVGIPKLILPHKRLMKMFKDYDGLYSFYGRDMHVFLCKDAKEIDELEAKLMQPRVKKMIESGFTIRMNFLEKYAFQYVI